MLTVDLWNAGQVYAGGQGIFIASPGDDANGVPGVREQAAVFKDNVLHTADHRGR
jgi:hypothetical protein